jgi:hypothetical protein
VCDARWELSENGAEHIGNILHLLNHARKHEKGGAL